MKATIKKTLILRLSSIGDIILTTPFIRVFHKAFPDTQLDFVLKKEYADLLRFHPHIHTLFELDGEGGNDELIRWKNFFAQQNYDYIFDLHNNFRTKFMRTGLKAPVYVINKRTLQRWLLVKFKWNLFHEIISVPDRYIETASSIGILPDGDGPDIYIPEKILHDVHVKIQNEFGRFSKPLIALCPGSKHFTKRWPIEYYSALAKRIINELNCGIIILGGLVDEQLAEVIIRSSGGNIFNGCNRYSILETAAAFDSCSLVVTNDSGLMHIASARKKSIISIFGSTVREFGFTPYNTDAIIFENKNISCRPCSHIGRDSCPKEHFRCMKEILPDAVFEEVKRRVDSIS